MHYKTWINQRSLHIETVTQSAEIRINSLRSSHDARIALLEEQRNNATDARIRRMKDGQIESANRDYERRLSELSLVKSQAEIISEVTVLGLLQVA